MDGSFANQVLAQIHLYEQKFADLPWRRRPSAPDRGSAAEELDEEVALEMVKGFGGVVTQLTGKQAEYIGVTRRRPVCRTPTATDAPGRRGRQRPPFAYQGPDLCRKNVATALSSSPPRPRPDTKS